MKKILFLLSFLFLFNNLLFADSVINNLVIEPPPACGGPCALPKTGQTTVYQTGDDGTYQKGYSGTRFTNNGDGTITDNATNLMWVANPTSAGVGGTYKWYDSALLTYPAIAACEDLIYAGHADWRLPNVKELQSIVDYGRYSPSINTTYFTSQSTNYWSGTTYAGSTDDAWDVNFLNGYVDDLSKTTALYVRPVRSSQ